MRKRVAPSAGPGGPPSTPQEGDQSAALSFLGDPRAYGLTGPVKRIDTQGAAVFLAGDDVYKVKRAIRLPFLDFSTLEKRRAACEAEIEVNRDNAPTIYLGVAPITRQGASLAIGGDGEAVEWAVHMRRFDENATLDRVAERGALTNELLRKLARAIRRSHERAPRRDGERATRRKPAARGALTCVKPGVRRRAKSLPARRATRRRRRSAPERADLDVRHA